MFSPLRNRFGIPGVISVIALVFAMLGGAYAASNSSGGGKATASAKAKRGPKGPKGATGPAGPAGPQGPAGANGKDGSNGSSGEKGATGANGTNGQSVTSVAENPGLKCEFGGFKLTSAGPKTDYVCNGAPGQDGQTGFTPTLPVGETEQGAWSVTNFAVGEGEGTGNKAVPISFNIPLAAELPSANVHYVPSAGPLPPACDDGVVPAPSVNHPEAASGHLCVFEGSFVLNAALQSIGKLDESGDGASTSGAIINVFISGHPTLLGGSWAVTG